MYGPAKALFVAAAVLQASANPVFKRQATSSTFSVSAPAPITETPGSLTSVSALPSITSSAAIPAPTPPTFPFPGGNSTDGTYYICSFPSSDNATTSSLPLSTDSPTDVLTSTASATLTDNGFAAEATTTSGSVVPTTTVSAVTSPIVTDPPVSSPTASATPFTVVGPSTATLVIECIQVAAGEQHQPHSGTRTHSFTPTPTATFSSAATATTSATDATTTSAAF